MTHVKHLSFGAFHAPSQFLDPFAQDRLWQSLVWTRRRAFGKSPWAWMDPMFFVSPYRLLWGRQL